MNTTPQRNIEANSGRIIECVQKTISTRPVEVHSKWLEHYLIAFFLQSSHWSMCNEVKLLGMVRSKDDLISD